MQETHCTERRQGTVAIHRTRRRAQRLQDNGLTAVESLDRWS